MSQATTGTWAPEGGYTNEERIQELARRFNVLRHHPHVERWDAIALDRSSRGMSRSEKLAIAFVLSVWNQFEKWKVGRFDAVEAYGCWDGQMWAAFESWARNPFTL